MPPFRIRGPDRRKARPAEAAGARVQAARQTSSRILLVEDDDDTRQLLAIALGGQGYQVEEAASAIEGLERLRSHRFDLVLSDYDLPGKTGAAMLKDAAEAGLLRETPTMVITAHPEPEGVDNVEVIRKPLDLDRFLHQVERILGVAAEAAARNPAAAPAAPTAVEVELVLYTSAKSPASLKARANLEALLKTWNANVKLVICDLAGDAKRAEEDHVVFTPTLVKRSPGPRAWILGDLSDREVVTDLLYMCGATPSRR